ncbi:MAG TPA: hypothetical protein VF432_10865 [Thermoanaerobaculia bacterium]
MRIFTALLVALVCLPALADDCPVLQTFTGFDVQTGEPVTFTWTYEGGSPQMQTLTGHDFDAPVVLAPDARSYTYTPSKPGEKHAQLAAVTPCGTVSRPTQYHVKQCNVVVPAMDVDRTSVAPGAVINASIELKPGHTARWTVTNGTASATTGSAIQVTAGGAGTVTINAWVSRGSSCAVLSTAAVEVVEACPIAEPQVYHPEVATADNWFYLSVASVPEGQTLSFAVHGARVDFEDGQAIFVTAPSQGSFSIDVILTNGTCTRTFTHTFTVEACHAAAVVKPGQAGECGHATAIAEFSGTAPFQGAWSDGEFFFTWDTTLERPISGGTYSISYVFDQYCQGTVTGSVTAGSSLPQPSFTIDEVVDGGYWGIDTCPGTVRTATLNGGIPAGATLEWSIPGGTIVSGQGTPVVQFAGQEIGLTRLTAVFRDANGCASAPYVQPFGHTMSTPELAVRVEPSTIPAGGTAVVTVDFLSYFTGGWEVVSSLGDPLVWIGNNQFEYRSTNGGGVATITANATNTCGSGSATTTLDIDGGNPLQATAKVRAIGRDCQSWAAFAEFTGVPPFTYTWSNGRTDTSSDPLAFMYPSEGGTYTLVEFSDANGPGTITGEATFDFATLPAPVISFDTNTTCPNTIVTATLGSPLPEGATANWYTWGGDIISGQGTASIQIQVGNEPWVGAGVIVGSPTACSPYSEPASIEVQSVQQPRFTTYGVYVGDTTQFDVILDPNTSSWNFENSLGDAMEVIANPRPNVYTLRYTSTHGIGDSYIRIYGTTACGQSFDTTGVMNVLPPPPTATLTSVPAEPCGAIVTATFTGTGPFTGTWSDGTPFSTSESTISRRFVSFDPVYVSVTDAHGGNAWSPWIYPELRRPDPIAISGPTQSCLGQQVTITADLPEGWQILWRVAPDPSDLSYGLRIVSGETSASVVVEGVIAERGILNPEIRTAEGCINYQDWYVDVTSCP